MPVAVKIKVGKYGSAIGLLLERGGVFQTRHERTLIVNSEQKKALEEAGLVETNGVQEKSGKEPGHNKASADDLGDGLRRHEPSSLVPCSTYLAKATLRHKEKHP